MEQKFLLKEIEKRLASMEADLAGIREILNQMIQEAEREAVTTEANVAEAAADVDIAPVVAEPPVAETVKCVVKSEEKHVQKVDGRLIADLRRAIGLNDSIRFCRELFGGDKALMDTTVSYLNDASSYMEALEYLAENFNWDDENETVKYFKDILSRKAYS
ncbi:MAG: hypothetical protein J6P34_05640 [Paludibacteraceae bacterium]|nr:hypothetical protein [Paludibacteraceae bacterium]MBO7367955.1 hypothetical protein [Paludibacteraceae bacterium]